VKCPSDVKTHVPIECGCLPSLAHICGEMWLIVQLRGPLPAIASFGGPHKKKRVTRPGVKPSSVVAVNSGTVDATGAGRLSDTDRLFRWTGCI
jgi:hypothetical protein